MFEQVQQSNMKGEFFGSMCRWHKRKDGQITIYEIVVEERIQGMGVGRHLLERLLEQNPTQIVAQCPADLPANGFYQHMGFSLDQVWETTSGRKMKTWVLRLSSTVHQETLGLPK